MCEGICVYVVRGKEERGRTCVGVSVTVFASGMFVDLLVMTEGTLMASFPTQPSSSCDLFLALLVYAPCFGGFSS